MSMTVNNDLNDDDERINRSNNNRDDSNHSNDDDDDDDHMDLYPGITITTSKSSSSTTTNNDNSTIAQIITDETIMNNIDNDGNDQNNDCHNKQSNDEVADDQLQSSSSKQQQQQQQSSKSMNMLHFKKALIYSSKSSSSSNNDHQSYLDSNNFKNDNDNKLSNIVKTDDEMDKQHDLNNKSMNNDEEIMDENRIKNDTIDDRLSLTIKNEQNEDNNENDDVKMNDNDSQLMFNDDDVEENEMDNDDDEDDDDDDEQDKDMMMMATDESIANSSGCDDDQSMNNNDDNNKSDNKKLIIKNNENSSEKSTKIASIESDIQNSDQSSNSQQTTTTSANKSAIQSASATSNSSVPQIITHVGRKPLNGPPCSLKTLVDDSILEPMDGALTYEILGAKFFGDLLPNGFIRMSGTSQIFANPSSWANYCRSTIPSTSKDQKNYGSAWSIIRYLGKRLDSYKLRWYRKQKKQFMGVNVSCSSSPSSLSSSGTTVFNGQNSSSLINNHSNNGSVVVTAALSMINANNSDDNSITNKTSTMINLTHQPNATVSVVNAATGMITAVVGNAPTNIPLDGTILASSTPATTVPTILSPFSNVKYSNRKHISNDNVTIMDSNRIITDSNGSFTKQLKNLSSTPFAPNCFSSIQPQPPISRNGVNNISINNINNIEFKNVYSMINRDHLYKLDKISAGDPEITLLNNLKNEKIIEFNSIDINDKDLNLNDRTKIRCAPFSSLFCLQPFLVTISTNVLLLIDFHSHLISTEVIGYLAGQWEPRTQHLTITQAFPWRTNIKHNNNNNKENNNNNDNDNNNNNTANNDMDGRILKIKQTLVQKGLILVGWYHSHPRSSPHPTIADIKRQLRYQKQMLITKKEIRDYSPCIGLICSPLYLNHDQDNNSNNSNSNETKNVDNTTNKTNNDTSNINDKTKETKSTPSSKSNTLFQMFWVMPIYTMINRNLGRPMQISYQIARDAFLTQDLLVEMRVLAAHFASHKKFIKFDEHIDNKSKISYWDKLQESLKTKLPRDLVEQQSQAVQNDIQQQALMHFWSFLKNLLLISSNTDQ